ncbi:glycosyltransferase family protein [Aquirufa sp. OSTEICH-129A]
MDIFKDHTKTLVVITTETSWNEIPRMRHHVALQLAKQNNILFVELDSSKKKSLNIFSDSIAILNLGGYIRGLNRFYFLKSIFDLYQARKIKNVVDKIDSPNKVILNFKFDFHQIYFAFSWDLKYYFMNDDFISMSSSSRQKNHRRKQQYKTISKSSRIFLSADALASLIEEDNKEISVIYSGHDFEINNSILIKSNSKPILCFMGFIHDNLEFEWLESLAKTNFYEIRLIGPVENPYIKLRFEKFENIKFYDALVGVELQHFLQKADAFLMPYKNLQVNTVSSVPAKLFQYLACGKPIISNKLPNLIKLPSYFVYQANSGEDFVNMVSMALKNDNEDNYKNRILFAAENTWSKRGEKINEILVNDLKFIKNTSSDVK